VPFEARSVAGGGPPPCKCAPGRRALKPDGLPAEDGDCPAHVVSAFHGRVDSDVVQGGLRACQCRTELKGIDEFVDGCCVCPPSTRHMVAAS
jgi:hypothetical protein